MIPKPATQPDWPVRFTIACSLLLFLMISGIGKVFILDARGVVDTTSEQAVFFIGLFLALPCGLLSLISALKARGKGWVTWLGIVTGSLCMLAGLLVWTWFLMVSAFAAAF